MSEEKNPNGGGGGGVAFTFQGSEVRAPFFPIQPMLWVLFQKVLSLANGPWSHEHMSPEEEEEEEEVQTARKQKKKKES